MSEAPRLPSKDYVGSAVTVTWEPALCIHTGLCTRGLPSVFDVRRRPWIDPDGAGPDEVAEVIERCPTSALRYRRTDAGAQEEVEAITSIEPQQDGPLYVRGPVRVRTGAGTRELTRAALCRCGCTGNAPFCDNSHRTAGYTSAD